SASLNCVPGSGKAAGCEARPAPEPEAEAGTWLGIALVTSRKHPPGHAIFPRASGGASRAVPIRALNACFDAPACHARHGDHLDTDISSQRGRALVAAPFPVGP